MQRVMTGEDCPGDHRVCVRTPGERPYPESPGPEHQAGESQR